MCQTYGVDSASDRWDAVFPIAGKLVRDLIEQAQVSDQWLRQSLLPKMSVGQLACHLGRQLTHAAELLQASTDIPPLESVDTHYYRAAWVTSSSPDDPPNDRTTDEAEAALGIAALRTRVNKALATLGPLLVSRSAADVIPIPWQGWSLARDDFLLTRMLEIVVHADDLALSVGVPTPVFPEEVFAPVRDLLVRLAARRHGQSAVISTLARAERSQVISAF
ncbi:mycothiol maleylpyruvate isomerase-like protein [Kribbella sp. VKM Ac-2566]|nr:mycothiol maleylpyruvate isomerase-like protein [Kribbella sp. VKM Ac-2566]